MKRISVHKFAGDFAGDKDAAAKIRDDVLIPGLQSKTDTRVILDFAGVDLATQSFVHALLSSVIRLQASDLERIEFQNCNQSIQDIIEIVAEYSQEDIADDL